MARRRGVKRIVTGNSMSNIDGFDEIRDLLQSLADRAPDVYEEELEKAAKSIESDTKSNINDKSGELSQSVTLRKYSGQKSVSYKVSAGGIKAPHAHLVEFGHRLVVNDKVVGDVPAHPFLRKAFEENKAKTEAALNAALDKLLKEV